MLYDPFRVGGLPAEDGPSGPQPGAPEPSGTVEDTNGGDIDHLALLSINDIEEFWRYTYPGAFPDQSFVPVKNLESYDSTDPTGQAACGGKTYRLVNAFFAYRCNLIAWDRGVLLPTAKKFFGDMAVTGLLAHEYGHAIQRMANLVSGRDPALVLEQQADCFAGTYLRWVAEGHSRRFTISTAVLLGAACPKPNNWPIRQKLFPDEPVMPTGCAIKGRINLRSQIAGYAGIYHLPSCRSYKRTEHPHRWFCSEEEAQADGFRKSLTC
jgi:predicted metalloprotease